MESEFKIKGLMMDPITNSPIVILQGIEKNNLLPIWVGIFEANAIALQIERIDTPRPMTHDLLKNILLHLNATVEKIVVTDLQENTFFATIFLDMEGDRVTIDSRPSDAIALAVRSDAPIYADDVVIEKAGIEMDEEPGKPMMSDNGENTGQPVREEELKSLSAFTDFINTLNLDDLGRQEKPPPETS